MTHSRRGSTKDLLSATVLSRRHERHHIVPKPFSRFQIPNTAAPSKARKSTHYALPGHVSCDDSPQSLLVVMSGRFEAVTDSVGKTHSKTVVSLLRCHHK